MKPLITEDDRVLFLIEITEPIEASLDFNIWEVTAWDEDQNIVLEYNEKYISGRIKWDGCSHIWFGDENGYMHLCGKSDFYLLAKVMDAVWKIAETEIKNFDGL